MSDASPLVRIIDDDVSFLAAIARFLKASGYATAAYPSAVEFLAAPGEDPGCVIVDLRMPGMDGIALQQALMRADNRLPLVFLTGEGDIPTTVRAMRDGAEDFLMKGGPKEELLAAVERAVARDARQRSQAGELRSARARMATLTARELEVLHEVLKGRLNKQIAADFGLHERTVKLHRTAITTKLQVRSVAELTRLAQAAGMF